LGSGGKNDADEFNWKLIGLANGWNYIRLPMKDAGRLGNPDLRAINWFRLYSFKSAQVTTKIDGIQLISDGVYTGASLRESTTKPGNEMHFQLYPNPVEDEYRIEFILAEPSVVHSAIYDLSGRKLHTAISEIAIDAGHHAFTHQVTDLMPGVYLYQISFNKELVSKVLMIK
jgi:hypothetical protein